MASGRLILNVEAQMDAMRRISADRTSKKEQKIQVQALAVMLANTDLNIDEKSCASTFVTASAIQAIRASVGLKDLPRIRPKKLTFLVRFREPAQVSSFPEIQILCV